MYFQHGTDQLIFHARYFDAVEFPQKRFGNLSDEFVRIHQKRLLF